MRHSSHASWINLADEVPQTGIYKDVEEYGDVVEVNILADSRLLGWQSALGVTKRRYPRFGGVLEIHAGMTEHLIGIPLHDEEREGAQGGDKGHLIRGRVKRGCFGVLPAYEPVFFHLYETDAAPWSDQLHLRLPADIFSSTFGLADNSPKRDNLATETMKSDAIIRRLAHLSLAELEGRGYGSRLFMDGLGLCAALYLAQLYHLPVQTPRRRNNLLDARELSLALDYLHAHATENISLDDLSALVELSPFHFNRLFSKSLGVPPHRFQLLLKIDKAKRLLSDMPFSIGEIAHTCGFADQSHLTRHFRSVTGVTPGQYRNATR